MLMIGFDERRFPARHFLFSNVDDCRSSCCFLVLMSVMIIMMLNVSTWTGLDIENGG